MTVDLSGSIRLQTEIKDRYDLLAKLGSGGMADVFLGIQRGAEGFEQLVVIKRIKDTRLSEKDDSLRMFIREARTVALLNHPHIVKVFDLCKMGDSMAIVMEYVDGENLEYLARVLAKAKRRMPLGILCRLMMQACEALHYAHTATTPEGRELKLVHRDVGPHNLMIDSSGYLKVIDFGIAKTTVQMDLTSPGIIKGKLSYLAPDLFKFSDIDHRIDVYALGLVFWRMLTLRVPFDFKPETTVAELIRRITTERLPKPSELVPELPPRVDDIVARATAIDREQRYQSCEEFGEEIARLAQKHGGAASATEVKKWYTKVFRARIEKRREFEKKVLDKARELAHNKAVAASSADDSTSRLISQPEGMDSTTPSGMIATSTPSRPLSTTWPPPMPSQQVAAPARKGVSRLWLIVAILLVAAGAAAVVVGYVLPRTKKEEAAKLQQQESVQKVSDNLRVVSQPPEAQVFIDGRPAGTTGTSGLIATLTPGREHLIEVRRDGYTPYTIKATGQREGRLEVVANLVKIPEGKNTANKRGRSGEGERTVSVSRPSGGKRPSGASPKKKRIGKGKQNIHRVGGWMFDSFSEAEIFPHQFGQYGEIQTGEIAFISP
ncbi:MAG: serine/threonine protein kinase [Deltaproteobacteria bacterium]|nr:MAG: serine/threonine protein kinase [Deltaproteobacteria bacterium]